VRGHVTPEEAIGAWVDHYGDPDMHLQLVTCPVTQQWGRWSMQAGEDGPGHVLDVHHEAGRGRFKITTIDVRGIEWAP
jgi:hypothetical protein